MNIKKHEVVRNRSKGKSRKELAKSAIFPEPDTDISSLSTPKMTQKSLSLSNLNGDVSKLMHKNDRHEEPSDSITISTKMEMPSNGSSIAVSDTKFGKSVEKRNGIVTEKVAIVTNNHLVSTNKNSKTETHAKSILKSFSTHNDNEQTMGNEQSSNYLYSSRENSITQKPTLKHKNEAYGPRNVANEQSTLIFMTQTSSDSDKTWENGEDNFEVNLKPQSLSTSTTQHNFNHSKEDQSDGNFNINIAPHNTTQDEEFKINIVQHDYNRSYSFSEDERSYQEEEPPHTFTRMGYSSQAASIFFGEDIEPEISRPRRIVLTDDDDDRRSSGADC